MTKFNKNLTLSKILLDKLSKEVRRIPCKVWRRKSIKIIQDNTSININ